MKKSILLIFAFIWMIPLFAQRKSVELPEIVVQSHKNQVLHILAVIRDYSTLTTYNDSVMMYREKLVDFMIPVNKKKGFEGWLSPRTLSSKSYYHFSDPTGLDSVSDSYNQHFSWSDWIEITDQVQMPANIAKAVVLVDSTSTPGIRWTRSGDNISMNVDVESDQLFNKFLSRLSKFRRNDLDFEHLNIEYNYSDVASNTLQPHELSDFTFHISSRNRGRNMFRFGRPGDDVFVNTRAEVYIVDREYISQREAHKWGKLKFSDLEIDTNELSEELDPLPQHIADLVARVESIDHDAVRLNAERDKLLRVQNIVPLSRKQKVLKTLKSIFLH